MLRYRSKWYKVDASKVSKLKSAALESGRIEEFRFGSRHDWPLRKAVGAMSGRIRLNSFNLRNAVLIHQLTSQL